MRTSLKARGERARHLHGRGPRALGALLVVRRRALLRRRVAHRVRHGLLERLVRVGVAQQEGDEGAAQVLGREGHARLALEHGLDGLGPARRAERLGVVDGGAAAAAAAEHEDVRLGRRRGEPRLRQPRPQERARRGGHGRGARAEEGGGLVRVGRAQVELEAAAGGGLEGDAQLELARHAHATRAHSTQECQ